MSGYTLIEMLTVIAIVAILITVAGPAVLRTLQSDTVVKTAANNVIADFRAAQNEAVRRGGGEMSPSGLLVRKSVFFVVSTASNSYSMYSYTDANGDGVRTSSETSPVRSAGILPTSVHFGTLASVNRTACSGGAGAPSAVVTFQSSADPPCNGARCVELDGQGFPSRANPFGGTIYLTNDTHAYAININAAGNATLCKWDGAAWVVIR
jgi:prepilin-type N-terminal cleavage/methylation domain-containing protein